jgi:general secretion pathway protein L
MKIIGVEVDGGKLRLAELDVSWKGSLTLLSCQEYPFGGIENPLALRKEIGRADQLIVSCPGRLISSRLLTLPFTQAKKIEQVLPYEMEPLLPFEPDQVILSWHPVSRDAGSSRLMVAATPREAFRQFIEKLHKQGIDPHQVEWDGMALFNFSQVVKGREKGVSLLMNIGAEESSLCFIKGGAPLMVRSIGGGAKALSEKSGWNSDHFLIREAVKTIQVLKNETGESVNALLICGEGGEIQNLPEALSRELSIPLEKWAIDPEKLKIAPAAPFDGDEIDPRFIPAIGLALKGTPLKGSLSQINFRKDEFSHSTVEKGKKGVQRTVLIFCLIIFFLGFVDLGIRYTIKKEHFEKTARQLLTEYRALFPGNGPVVNEVDQARASIIQLKKREAFFNMSGGSSLEILKEMTVQIPKEVKIDVNELSIGSDRIRLDGETDSFDALDKIKESLGKSGSFSEIAVADSKMNAEESKVRFKIEMVRKTREVKK